MNIVRLLFAKLLAEDLVDNMRTFIFDEQGIGAVMLNEAQIIERYWGKWFSIMIDKYGEGHPLIIPENCINEWVLVHDAYEKKA